MRPRPTFVPVKLHDLTLREEFVDLAEPHEVGEVIDFGFRVETDRTGRGTRVRYVLVRHGFVEVVLSAETVVLVAWERRHVVDSKGEDRLRWSKQLRDPQPFAVVAERIAREAALGPTIRTAPGWRLTC